MARARFRWIPLAALASALSSATAARAEEPSLSPPAVVLSVTPGTNGGPWKMRVENTGELPLRLAADARLLSLVLTVPVPSKEKGAPKDGKITCTLPADARPTSDEGRDLVIPGKRAWSATFDPLFYCFGPRERAALAAGTVVTASLGFPTPPTRGTRAAKPTAPFVLSPVGAAIASVAAVKSIESASFTLTDAVTATGPTPTPPPSELALSVPVQADAARGVEIGTTVSLTNVSDRAQVLLFRPETLAFRVSGPAGSTVCGTPRTVSSPIRELFTTVGPRGRADFSILLTSMCPSGTFDAAGIYRVFPHLDTTGASGRPVGLKTWDGTLAGTTPLLVRVRSPRYRAGAAEPRVRPALD